MPTKYEPANRILSFPSDHSLCGPAAQPSDRVTEPTSSETEHPFAKHVNPYLAEMLSTLEMDKRFVRGEASRLFDTAGKAYLDCVAAYGALPFGFNPAEIWAALRGVQVSGEPSLVQPSCLEAAGELAERLVELAPGDMSYVTFANSGAEAVEAAIKMCRIATGRKGIITTNNSFHGKTLGALAATGNTEYQEGFAPQLEHFAKIPYGDADALRDLLEGNRNEFAAVIIEPIQGEGGIVQPPTGYLAEVREICDVAKVLLVFDEVQTGLGRTGRMFGCEHEGVAPDVMTLAKALGGGLIPIGAVLANEKAYSRDFALKHSSTFAGNTLAARAGLATLDLLTRNNGALVEQVRRNGEALRARLEDLQRRFPQILNEVRGRGYMLGISLGVDRNTWPESLLGIAAEQSLLAPVVASYLLNVEGIRVAPTLNGKSVIRIEPALTLSWAECEELIGALERTLQAFSKGNTGQILTGILMGRPFPVLGPVETSTSNWDIRPLPGERRFAFLIHPLDLVKAGDFDPNLSWLPDELLADITERLTGIVEPFVLNPTRVTSTTGETIYGEFIVVPRTAAQLAAMPRREAAAHVQAALDIAKERGAEMVGLGAFTSVVTRGGRSVAGQGVALTTGNSYTAVACVEGIAMAMQRLGERLDHRTSVAVVGATGAIGRAMALLLAEEIGRLVLMGNPESDPDQVRCRLMHVAATVGRHLAARHSGGTTFAEGTLGARLLELTGGQLTPDIEDERWVQLMEQLEAEKRIVLTQDIGALPTADVVVASTSATGTLIGPHDLRAGAVVCDLSRPLNVSREVADARPDVLVIDGGLIAVPGLPHLGRLGMEQGHAYSCMAETMLLTLAGHIEDTSLGKDLTPETLRMLKDLADRHGFELAQLRSFGKEFVESDWARLQSARLRVSDAERRAA